jgi:hypothetical protein
MICHACGAAFYLRMQGLPADLPAAARVPARQHALMKNHASNRKECSAVYSVADSTTMRFIHHHQRFLSN